MKTRILAVNICTGEVKLFGNYAYAKSVLDNDWVFYEIIVVPLEEQ